MRFARMSWRGSPRLTLRRVMIYVAVIAVALDGAIALPPDIEMTSEHWARCRGVAAEYDELASRDGYLAEHYPGDTVIAHDVGRYHKKRQFIPDTGEMAARRVPYHEAAARIYERAKWRPWAGLPTDVPQPPEP